jgi:hypothetical protein
MIGVDRKDLSDVDVRLEPLSCPRRLHLRDAIIDFEWN